MKTIIIILVSIMLIGCGNLPRQRYAAAIEQINLSYAMEKESLQKPVRKIACDWEHKGRSCFEVQEQYDRQYYQDAQIYNQQIESIERSRIAELNNVTHQYNAYRYSGHHYNYERSYNGSQALMINAIQTLNNAAIYNQYR